MQKREKIETKRIKLNQEGKHIHTDETFKLSIEVAYGTKIDGWDQSSFSYEESNKEILENNSLE